MVILLSVNEDAFVLESSKDTLHEAFGFLRAVLTEPWEVDFIAYGSGDSFWYNIQRLADNELMYQIRVLA